MGGGGSTSRTRPELPPELRQLFGGTASRINDVFSDKSLNDAFGVGPRGVAGADPMEVAAYNNVNQFFSPTESGTAAFDTASQLSRPSQYQGVDLSGVGSAADYGVPSFGSSFNQAPREAPYQQPGREQQPDAVESAINSIDFANHPALKSAMKSFEAATLPGLANQMGAAGLSRSGAAGSAISSAKAQMAVPIMQQLIGSAVTERGQDIGQREQDIQSLLTQRGQDIEGILGGRGQDVTQRGQDMQQILNLSGLGLQARGQDLDALLQQGSQGLQARGQDLQSMVAAMGGFENLNAADLQRLTAGMGAATDMGALMRGIQQEGLNSEYDAAIRDSDLLTSIGLAPLGGITSAIGSTTTSSGGK